MVYRSDPRPRADSLLEYPPERSRLEDPIGFSLFGDEKRRQSCALH